MFRSKRRALVGKLSHIVLPGGSLGSPSHQASPSHLAGMVESYWKAPDASQSLRSRDGAPELIICVIYWGWGFAQVWRRFLFVFFLFFSGFHLPDKWNVQTAFGRFLVRSFLCPFLVRRFLRPFLHTFLVRRFLRRFSADFSSTFWRSMKNKCSRVTQKCTENLRKNLRRPKGPARRGTPFRIRFLEQTARHTIAARPTYSRKACERPS